MMTANMFGELTNSLWWLFPVPVLIAMVFTPWFKEHVLKKLHASTSEEEPGIDPLVASWIEPANPEWVSHNIVSTKQADHQAVTKETVV